jgi:hypothetical protein
MRTLPPPTTSKRHHALQAMLETLRKLDEFKLVHPDDLETVDIRQHLLRKITDMILEDFTNPPKVA